VKNVEEGVKKMGWRLPTANVDTLINTTYTPEMDMTENLNENDATYFQELIGVLRWATEG
jgi:hypothetical protein